MLITKFIYIVYIVGVIVWQYQSVYDFFSKVRVKMLIRRNMRLVTDFEEIKVYGAFGEHIRLMIESCDIKNIFKSVESFYAVSIIFAFGTFLTVSMVEDITMSAFCGLFVGIMPYCIASTRLHSQRVIRSREGDVMVDELLNNYKIYHYNIKEALETTASSLEDAPNAARLLINMARGLNSAVTKEEVERVLDIFKYSIDTAWGNVLATNIFFAHVYGIRIDAALNDLSVSINKSRQVIEHEKRENNEAYLILKYLAPISLILTVIGAVKYFGFTFEKYIKYQFGTSTGLKWFLIMAMVYGAGILINSFFSRDKMDI